MKKQGLIMGSVILVATVVITKILGLIYKIPLTNILGGTGMGYYSSAYTVFMPIYALCISGIPAAISKTVAENAAFGRFRNVRRIKRISLIGFSMTGLLASFAALILSYPVSKYILHDTNSFLCVIAISPSIFIGSVMAVYRGYFEGLRNMMPTAVSEVIESVLKVLLGLGGAYAALYLAALSFEKNHTVFGKYVESADMIIPQSLPYISAMSLLGVTLSTLISTLFIVLRCRFMGDGITKEMLNGDKTTERMRTVFKRVAGLALPIAVSTVITTFVSMIDLATIPVLIKRIVENDRLFELSGLGTILSGMDKSEIPTFIYGSFTGLVLTVFGLVPSLTGMFGKSALPNVAESFAVKNTQSLKKNTTAVIMACNLISMPCAFGITLFSKPVLSLLFSSRVLETEVSYRALSFLGTGIIFISLTVTTFSLLQAIGDARSPLKILSIGVAIKLVLNIVLMNIAVLNISGAAISTTVCYMFISIASLKIFFKKAGIKPDLKLIFLKPAIASLLCSVAMLLCYGAAILRFGSKLSLVISTVAGGIIYIISLGLLSIFNKKTLKSIFLRKKI